MPARRRERYPRVSGEARGRCLGKRGPTPQRPRPPSLPQRTHRPPETNRSAPENGSRACLSRATVPTPRVPAGRQRRNLTISEPSRRTRRDFYDKVIRDPYTLDRRRITKQLTPTRARPSIPTIRPIHSPPPPSTPGDAPIDRCKRPQPSPQTNTPASRSTSQGGGGTCTAHLPSSHRRARSHGQSHRPKPSGQTGRRCPLLPHHRVRRDQVHMGRKR